MLLTDMTMVERFKNMRRAKKVADTIRKSLGLPKIKVLFIEQLPPGFNALFVTHCLLLKGHYVMNDKKGEPVIFLDMHYALPQYHEGMVDRVAHELRHYYQYLHMNEAFMSSTYMQVLNEDTIGSESKEFYSWREVDARNWSQWYCAGAIGDYVTSKTDKELQRYPDTMVFIGFLGGVLTRFEESAKFVFHTFD